MATAAVSANAPAVASGQTLEALLFKATNPVNKLEDVNTIKQFCDAVNSNVGGDSSVIACRLLAHKIQSPLEREAIQALAVLEACVKSCGSVFHAEIGKFKFLNEMIKLVSPKYLAGRTPEHIKKKVIELLYLWSTKELKNEGKIAEAYSMLKKQGIVKEDPVYVGDAVFASALPPRKSAPLNEEETQRLRRLLQSKNPDDLQMANKIIKGMVQEDERKMDALTKRATELTMVNNNAKLLGEMLDHFDKDSCGGEEKQLLYELFQSCEKMQPKLFRLAADTEEDDESSLAKILQASDDINKVIERYKMVVIQGKPDILKSQTASSVCADQLLDLNVGSPLPDDKAKKGSSLLDDDLLGLALGESSSNTEDEPENKNTEKQPTTTEEKESSSQVVVVPDLLNDDSEKLSETAMPIIPLQQQGGGGNKSMESPKREEKTSRQKGLEELDFLGESLMKQHLPGRRSPQFDKKKDEKMTLHSLQQKQKEKDLVPTTVTFQQQKQEESELSNGGGTSTNNLPNKEESSNASGGASPRKNGHQEEVKLADLNVPISSIKPGQVPPLTLQESDDGISIVLHFGQDQPRQHVSAIVVTVINKLPDAISDYEMKAVVPKGCKVKVQAPTTTTLPAHNPFVPPSAITQVMLIANPAKKDVSLKYIVSYSVDGEPQTEMGQVAKLPIS